MSISIVQTSSYSDKRHQNNWQTRLKICRLLSCRLPCWLSHMTQLTSDRNVVPYKSSASKNNTDSNFKIFEWNNHKFVILERMIRKIIPNADKDYSARTSVVIYPRGRIHMSRRPASFCSYSYPHPRARQTILWYANVILAPASNFAQITFASHPGMCSSLFTFVPTLLNTLDVLLACPFPCFHWFCLLIVSSLPLKLVFSARLLRALT